MLTLIVAYICVGFASCIALAPMYMAGIAFAQDATLWGVYPVLALGWFIMFSDWVSTKIGNNSDDDEDEDVEEG